MISHANSYKTKVKKKLIEGFGKFSNKETIIDFLCYKNNIQNEIKNGIYTVI